MGDETKRILQRHEEYLREWIHNIENAATLIPQVKQALEIKAWELKALSEAPEATEDNSTDHLRSTYLSNYNGLLEALPQIPYFDSQNAILHVTSSAASGTATFDYISNASHIPDPATQEWSTRHTTIYQGMQETHDISGKVRELLRKLEPNLVNEFDDIGLAMAFTLGNAEPAITIKMRNVLEHYKGQLCERARQPLEQKVSWQAMADRLSLAPIGSKPHQELVNQEASWKQIHNDLTYGAKNQGWKKGFSPDVQLIKVRLIDHLHTVLSLVKL